MAENGVRQWVSDANLVKLLIVIVLAMVGQIYLNISTATQDTARNVSEVRDTITGISKDVGHLSEDDADLRARMARLESITQANTDKAQELQRRLDSQKVNRLEKRYQHERVAVKAEGLAHKRDLNDLHKQLIAADRAKAVQ
jgi:hypothetical protein